MNLHTRQEILRPLLAAVSLALLTIVMSGCANQPQQRAPAPNVTTRPEADLSQGHEEWSYNQVIYEVNIRQYTEEGTFAAFAEHLDRLEDMGVGILWLMPIHPIGDENRLGSQGSYYSVQDYAAVHPDYGSMQEFRELVTQIHERDMRVIMDWVPNHTSWDNVLTETHPEWYATNAEGEFISPPGTNWSDVIQLDHSQKGLREYMIDVMSFWVGDVGVDGFRFDAVNHVSPAFLIEINNALKAEYPEIFLLAEADGIRWHEFGYSASFAWGLYGFGSGLLMQVAEDSATANEVAAYFAKEQQDYGDAYRVYFTDTHDENSWEGTTADRFGEAEEAFAVLTQLAPGMPLIYSGQEVGLDHQLEFFEKDRIEWDYDHPYSDMYTTLVQLKRENQALWNGEFGGPMLRIDAGSEQQILAFLREQNDDAVFALLNLSDEPAAAELEQAIPGEWREVFRDETTALASGSEFELAAWDYAVYTRTAE